MKTKWKNLLAGFSAMWKKLIEENSLRSNLILYIAVPFIITLILEGLDLEDPIQFNQDILKLMME